MKLILAAFAASARILQMTALQLNATPDADKCVEDVNAVADEVHTILSHSLQAIKNDLSAGEE